MFKQFLNIVLCSFKKQIFFLFISSAVISVGLIASFLMEKKVLHLAINSFHHPILDYFFLMMNIVGEGLFGIAVIVICFFFHKKNALFLLISWLLSTGITQLLKRFVFEDALRPLAYFGQTELLPLVPGVTMHSFHSFPSGHATSAFAICFGLSLILFEKKWQVFLVIMAILGAFSRVYLSQHFIIDIAFGAIIGSISTFLIYNFFKLRLESKQKPSQS